MTDGFLNFKTLNTILPFFCIIAWSSLLSTVVAAELPRTGQRSCYDQAGAVIDHVGTGQDGDLQSGVAWPEPRFFDNGDGTVSDHLTGLMWLQDGYCLGSLSWQAAVNSVGKINASNSNPDCSTLRVNYDDWSLPDITALETLFNYEDPYVYSWLNSWGFTNIQPGAYWSATTSPNPYSAWLFLFDTGEVKNVGKVEPAQVLLVRREQPPDVSSGMIEEGFNQERTGERFLDNGDGTVTDPVTGLMWLKDAGCAGTADWQAALETVGRLNDNLAAFNCRELQVEYDDWALPNRHQLRSLIDPGVDLPALTAGHPFVDIRPGYWSSTSWGGDPARAYDLFMGTGALHLSRKIVNRSIWPVRSTFDKPDRERIAGKSQAPVYRKSSYMIRSTGEHITVSWPATKFTDLGDGTLLDNVTGLVWLKDTKCLGRRLWEGSFVTIRRLNQYPWRVKCEGYSATYDDWQLPELETLAQLIETSTGEPADWLNQQGAVGLSPRDYWSLTENPYNLYYAWGVNLRQGTPRNYSKKFQLYVWPVRWPKWTGPVTAEPLITGNDSAGKVELQQGEKILLSVAVSSVTRPVQADFKVWYSDSDGTLWWLTTSGQWSTEETVLYHGNLFKLDSYPVFYGSTTGMAAGNYTFHFDISINPDVEGLHPVFSSSFSLLLSDGNLEEQYLAKGLRERAEEE